MRRFFQASLLAVLLAGSASRVLGFAIQGPFSAWQLQPIGYQLVGDITSDIGGPKYPDEAYRWNIPLITYAFDQSWVFYFGSNGMAAVDAAMSLLNAVTNANQLNLDDYPLDSRRQNFQASDARLLDVKSFALVAVLSELGVAAPERWVWSIRERFATATPTNYLVNRFNYDPLTWQTSMYVNDALYSYVIADPIADPLGLNAAYADADEQYMVSKGQKYSSVAGGLEGKGRLNYGEFLTGLTRDDVGALRFLLNTNLVFNETLIPGVTGYTNTNSLVIPGWIPWFGGSNANANFTNSYFLSNILAQAAGNSNALGTNATNTYIATGLRGGVGKLLFQNVTAQYESLIGPGFVAFTNVYYENVLYTNSLVQQQMQRIITAPDILFTVEDLPINGNGLAPVLIDRTLAAAPAWVNNDALNGQTGAAGTNATPGAAGGTALGGPGVIAGPIRITFTRRLPYYIVSRPNNIWEEDYLMGGTWATFDQTTNAPILYPQYMQLSLDDLLRMARRGPVTP